MAKRLPYSISYDDPDIIRFKETYPDIYETMFDYKFDSLPGKEIETWNSLNYFNDTEFGEYIDHCLEHYNFLLGRWSDANKEKIVNFMLTLVDADFGGNAAIKESFLKIDELCSMLSDSTKAKEMFNFSFTQKASISAREFNLWVTELSNTFIEISNDCELAGLLNKLIDTGSQSFVKKYHFLASQAAFLAALSYKDRNHSQKPGICFIPVVFKMLQQAIIWQQDDKVELQNEAVLEFKRRKLDSPDSFLFRNVSNGKNSQLFRSITRDFFIKAWLFKLIESKISNTGKPLSKQALINEMSKRIPECATMPPKTLENLLTNLKETGYVSARLDKIIEENQIDIINKS